MKCSKMCMILSLSQMVLFFFLIPQICLAAKPVKYLPGFEGPLPFELETGYIGVGEADEVQLYYYFVKSQSNPKTDPLILWLVGGPGCSALYAVVTEIGPVLIDDREYNGSLPTLSLNPYAYTEMANIIFVDWPVGTGFSYATTQRANHSDSLLAGDHAYQFLRKWLLDEHPEYLSNPFYLGGDSYGGVFVPIVTKVISDGNDMGTKPKINLKGYILGNPSTYEGEDNYKIPYTHGMGLISDELYESLQTNCGGEYLNIDKANTLCRNDMNAFNRMCDGIYEYHILEPVCHPVSSNDGQSSGLRRTLREKIRKLKNPDTLPGVKCRTEWYDLSVIWANDENVRKALHVRKGTTPAWVQCRWEIPFTITIDNVIPYHAYLSSKGFRSLIYSGDHDLSVPFIATEAWIKSLNYSIVDDWRAWIVDGQVAGYTRSYANRMTYATLKGSGHTAPEWTPMECHAMLKRWMSYAPL